MTRWLHFLLEDLNAYFDGTSATKPRLSVDDTYAHACIEGGSWYQGFRCMFWILWNRTPFTTFG